VLTATPLNDAPGRPLLLLGPSLGSSAATQWTRCASRLRGDFQLVAWDLPGHGASVPAASAFGAADLAREVLALADRFRPGETFGYAGVSLGGAVGLQLLLDAPGRVGRAALICTGAKIGEAAAWHERAATVRAEGTAAIVEGSIGRWFAPGFPARHPEIVRELAAELRGVDDESYALACEALAAFDVRDRLGEIGAPVLAIAGARDQPAPPDGMRSSPAPCSSGGSWCSTPPPIWPTSRFPTVSLPCSTTISGTPPGSGCAARCSATPTSTGPRRARLASPATSRSSSPRTPGKGSGPAPAWTAAAAR
jgi:3-oxoadipate enol-lactonase / 4-carboxymuconolactone decarboxylase